MFDRDAMDRKATRRFGQNQNLFYSWECLSIVRANNTTLDFVVKDPYDLMYLYHCLVHSQMKKPALRLPGSKGCLSTIKVMKFKMKISYESWKQKQRPHDIILMALQRTLSDLKLLAEYKVQSMLKGSQLAAQDKAAKSKSQWLGRSSSEEEESDGIKASEKSPRGSALVGQEDSEILRLKKKEDLLIEVLIRDSKSY